MLTEIQFALIKIFKSKIKVKYPVENLEVLLSIDNFKVLSMFYSTEIRESILANLRFLMPPEKFTNKMYQI